MTRLDENMTGSPNWLSDIRMIKAEMPKNFIFYSDVLGDNTLEDILSGFQDKESVREEVINNLENYARFDISSIYAMLKRNGFMPAVSVGAFADRTLVGFILNGVRDWDNEKTVYDLGTGVIPDFRRTGIMGELLNLVSTICIKNKISVYQLEVIQDNEKALTLYKKQGFRINRILNCYQLTGKIKESGVHKVWKLEHPEKYESTFCLDASLHEKSHDAQLQSDGQ